MCNDSIMDVMKIGMAITAIVCVIVSGTLVINMIQEVGMYEYAEEVVVEETPVVTPPVTVNITPLVCTVVICVTIVALVVARNKHKERMAEINLAILRTPIEQL